MPLEALLHLAGIAEHSFVWYVRRNLPRIQNHIVRGNKSKRLYSWKKRKAVSPVRVLCRAAVVWTGDILHGTTASDTRPLSGGTVLGGVKLLGRET